MELPEDVLSIVRAYSKPIFEYYHTYNHALKVLGKKKWPKLKEKLQEEPEVAIPALNYYIDAFIKKKEMYLRRDQFNECVSDVPERCIEKNQIHNMCFYAKRSEEDVFWLLIRILYGNGKEYWDVNEAISI